MPSSKSLVFIPTYNESENVHRIHRGIESLGLGLDILFLDDNSPDGTGEILDKIAAANRNVSVVHREGKQGIGTAHQAGIRYAYEKGYERLITMDCDFTHSPEHLETFLRLSEQDSTDVVIGSRYMRKKSLERWNLLRKAMTVVGHFLTDSLLGMPYDATGAYRLYNLKNLQPGLFDLVRSRGYSFFFESLYVLHLNGAGIREFPISLPARTYGHSKMRYADVYNSVKQLVHVCLQTWMAKETFLYSPAAAYDANEKLVDKQDWDSYWKKKDEKSGLVYDLVAAFYRKFIIKRSLDLFVGETFAEGAEILHAGCGGGQADAGPVARCRVTALDISTAALNSYAKIHGGAARPLHGSIFEIPDPDSKFDGIYNLGVMEHFTEDEIVLILGEFRRTLKEDGRLLLFWPPVFGVSVLFLDSLHFLLNRVFGMNVKLHPDEITRIRSRKATAELLARGGFELERFYFGPRDLFTCVVVVAKKTK